MPSSMVRTFTDPDEYTSAIRAAEVEISMMKSGDFAGQLIRIDLHRLWMQRFSETLPRIAHIANGPGRAIISFATGSGASRTTGGIEIPQASISWDSQGYSRFERTAGAVNLGAMSLPLADMEALGASFSDADFTPPRDPLIFAAPPAALARLLDLHRTAGQLAEDAPEVIAEPEAARGLEQALLAALADCLCARDHTWDHTWDHPRDRPAAASVNRRHGQIMKRFHAVLATNPDRVLHVPEVCKVIGTSNRTLTTCCNEALGMSPGRYLRVRQLNLARRALVRADPASATVTEIATAHGFWELGRFAAAYAALFGERPSATLRRRPDDDRILPRLHLAA
jgi:AraC-like DNA-binding protein